MFKKFRNILILSGILIVLPVIAVAQQINFSLYASQNITLNATTETLNFNSKQTVIERNSGATVTVALTDQPAVIALTAQADMDVTVTISPPAYLELEGGTDQIPVTIAFAYSNKGATNEADAKAAAIEVPYTFSTATFPVKQRATGTRALPPTPNHVGYTPPSATAYLFVYGSLGPVGAINAGIYTGEITITVEYSSYD
jgi:hypothetical protein